jgi:plasmid stability protein
MTASLHIKDDLHWRLKVIAATKKTSLREEVEEVLREHTEREWKRLGIKRGKA